VLFVEGAVLENHRKEWISGPTLGTIHHSKWRLPAAHKLDETSHYDKLDETSHYDVSLTSFWCYVELYQDSGEC
jgi:hypothetical protein